MQFENLDELNVALLLQKIDRILAGEEKIVVQEESNLSHSLACSNPAKLLIYLNFQEIQKLKTIKDLFDYLVMLKGLNYHELAHILYTDYGKRKIYMFLSSKYTPTSPSFVSISDFVRAINMLEDCRIENMFYTQYRRAKYYFSFCASNILMKEATQIEINDATTLISAYIILYGRKFLFDDIRYKKSILEIKNKLQKSKIKTKISAFEKIIDNYILEFDLDERLELAYKLTLLLENEKIQLKQYSDDGSLTNSKSRRGTKKRIKDAINKLLKDLEKHKQEQKQDKSKQKVKNTNALLEEIAEDIEKSEQIQKEVNTELNKMGAGSEFREYSGQLVSITNRIKLESKRVEHILRKLRSDLSTQIFRFQKKGKVDIISAIKSQKNHNLNVFRKERLNKIDKSKLGVCFLLDTSGSISNSEFHQEVNATLCLNKALERLDNKVEIIEFSHHYRIMKKFNGEGDWQRTFNGGTLVSLPLEKSIVDLRKLRSAESIRNLFIIVISDGEFGDYSEVIEVLNKAKKNNISTIWIYASDYDYMRDRTKKLSNSFDFFIRLKNLDELSIKLNKIIKDIQRKINQNILNQNQFYG